MVIQHRLVVLALAGVLTLLSAWLASQLQIDSDLRALLPRDHEVIEAIEAVEDNFGAVGSINIVIEGGTPEARHALADAIAEGVADDEMLREVEHRLDNSFFVEHALYYLPESEMDALVERVEAWQHYEFCSAAPDVCIEPPDAEAPAALQRFIDDKRAEAQQRAGFDEYFESEEEQALALFLRPTQSSANLEFAVEVSDRMIAKVHEIAAGEGPWSQAQLRVNLVGPYVNKAIERKIIGGDIVRSGAFALAGVIVVLYLLFRSTRAVLTLLVPLMCGVTWSLGATQLALGHLNSITSLISSVVMGIGIDAGIHFLARARREREFNDSETSIRRAFEAVIAPLLIASSTTASAFVVMASSEFPAFGEFGVIAGLGVGLCLLAMVTVFPALLATVGVKPAVRMPEGGIGAATRVLLARPGLIIAGVALLTLASFSGVQQIREDGFERSTRALQSDRARAELEADVFLIADIFGRDPHASVLAVPDYATLEALYAKASAAHAAREASEDTRVSELWAAPTILPPAEIDLEARHARIDALTEDWSPRTWARLEGKELAPQDELGWDSGGEDGEDEEDEDWGTFEPYEGEQPEPPEPPEPAAGQGEGEPPEPAAGRGDPAQPEPAAGPAEDEGGPPEPGQPEPEVGSGEDEALELSPEDGAQLRRMLEAEPFGPTDLPPEAIGKLRGADGSWGMFAYPNYDAADIYTGVEFMEEIEGYADGNGTFAGEPTVYATILETLNEEWPVVIGLSLAAIVMFVFWQVRSVGQTLITIAPLALAFWWTFGILGALELKLSLFNVPVLPAILGIGVDNGVYLTAAIRRETSTNTGLHRSVDETGRAILAATMTTAVGFGAFLVADNGGLRTIGQLAVIGIMSAAFASLLAVPTIAALVQRRRSR